MQDSIIQLIDQILDKIQTNLSILAEGLEEPQPEVRWKKLTDPTLRLAPRDTPYLFKLGKKTAKVRLQYTSSYLDSKGVSNDQAGS